ncbi:hypothetical protein, partial [Escherichia coli]|uniref:hypothetical protein n=1 Tax=Escherichia coli TaxID=562 RepID=UPI001BA7CD26
SLGDSSVLNFLWRCRIQHFASFISDDWYYLPASPGPEHNSGSRSQTLPGQTLNYSQQQIVPYLHLKSFYAKKAKQDYTKT